MGKRNFQLTASTLRFSSDHFILFPNTLRCFEIPFSIRIVILLTDKDLAIRHNSMNICVDLKQKESQSYEKPTGRSDIPVWFVLTTELKYLLSVGTVLGS